MGRNELEQVLDILSKAIVRETVSFNYYFKAGKNTTLPDGVRGLLSQLAEEERVHRKLLLNEYIAIQKGWSGNGSEGRNKGNISYSIPEHPEFAPLEKSQKLDLKAVILPSRLVGGDNILARVVRKPACGDVGLFLTLYDAMGHGIETTRINSRAASVLGEYLDNFLSSDSEKEILWPSRSVSHLNREFSAEFEGKGVFLTLFSAYIDLEENVLNYTIAGHDPPMVVRDDGRVDSLLNTQLVLGIDEKRVYSEYSIPFGSGDMLCVFSDGILEARNPEGDVYGRQRLSDVLSGQMGKTSEDVILAILDNLREFCAGESLEDELTIAVIRCCRD